MVAIDLGSNTIRFLEYDCEKKQKINEFEKMVKTAENLVFTNEISQEAVDRIIEAIEEAKEKLNFNDVKAIATYAFRKAKNKNEVLEAIKSKTGIEFEIVNHEKEAFFAALAIEECILNHSEEENISFLAFDIGGGSTEIIFKNKKEVLNDSLPLGIVTLANKYADKFSIQNEVNKYKNRVKEFLNLVYFKYRKPKYLVASSGTPTTLAALKHNMTYKTYDASKINMTTLTIEEIDEMLDKLLKLEIKQREKLVGVGRSELIIAGIVIFKELFRWSGFDKCIVCDDGVREGVAIFGCKNKN